MEFVQTIACIIFGYLLIAEGTPIKPKRTSQSAIRLSLQHANAIPKMVLEHLDKRSSKFNFLRRNRNMPADLLSSFQEECDLVYEAYQHLITTLPKIMDQKEIDDSLSLLGEGFDAHDPDQLHEVSCIIVSFARNHLIDTLPEDERKKFEGGLMVFKITVNYMEALLANADESDLVDMDDEVEAITALIQFYRVLQQIGFIPSQLDW